MPVRNAPPEGLPEVLQTVGLLYRKATRTIEHDQSNLPVGTRAVLELLTLTPPQPVPRIAESLLLSRQFVQRSVDHGVDAGILELVPNPAHQRSNLVQPTKEGRQTMARLAEHERQLLATAERDLTEEQIATCLHVLRTVYTNTAWGEGSERQ